MKDGLRRLLVHVGRI